MSPTHGFIAEVRAQAEQAAAELDAARAAADPDAAESASARLADLRDLVRHHGDELLGQGDTDGDCWLAGPAPAATSAE